MQTPEPNSAAWLEALYKTDPMLAAHVRALLADVGRSDVCAICGDDHPADYQLCAFRPMTLRLCTYCHSLYRDTYGAALTPLNVDPALP